jgi:hypothetical protein
MRWRQVNATLDAIQWKPEAYSREEIEQAVVRKAKLGEEFIRTYGLDDTQSIKISLWAGTVFEHPEKD